MVERPTQESPVLVLEVECLTRKHVDLVQQANHLSTERGEIVQRLNALELDTVLPYKKQSESFRMYDHCTQELL